jgi:hypothetical protein
MFNPDLFVTQAPFWEDKTVASRFLLHDCTPKVVQEVFPRLRPEPGVLGSEVTPFQVWPDVPCAYIVCADDRVATPTHGSVVPLASAWESSPSSCQAATAPSCPARGNSPRHSTDAHELPHSLVLRVYNAVKRTQSKTVRHS